MSTFNVSQKIGAGGVFNKTTVGSQTILTTSANQYARVIMSGFVNSISGAATIEVLLGGVVVKSATGITGGGFNGCSLHSEGQADNATTAYGGGVQSFEVLVPPSTSFALNAVGSSPILFMRGSYVLIENTI